MAEHAEKYTEETKIGSVAIPAPDLPLGDHETLLRELVHQHDRFEKYIHELEDKIQVTCVQTVQYQSENEKMHDDIDKKLAMLTEIINVAVSARGLPTPVGQPQARSPADVAEASSLRHGSGAEGSMAKLQEKFQEQLAAISQGMMQLAKDTKSHIQDLDGSMHEQIGDLERRVDVHDLRLDHLAGDVHEQLGEIERRVDHRLDQPNEAAPRGQEQQLVVPPQQDHRLAVHQTPPQPMAAQMPAPPPGMAGFPDVLPIPVPAFANRGRDTASNRWTQRQDPSCLFQTSLVPYQAPQHTGFTHHVNFSSRAFGSLNQASSTNLPCTDGKTNWRINR